MNIIHPTAQVLARCTSMDIQIYRQAAYTKPIFHIQEALQTSQRLFSSQSQYFFIYYIYGKIKIGKHNNSVI
jgi:hypothetical protein